MQIRPVCKILHDRRRQFSRYAVGAVYLPQIFLLKPVHVVPGATHANKRLNEWVARMLFMTHPKRDQRLVASADTFKRLDTVTAER